jgi:lysozyme
MPKNCFLPFGFLLILAAGCCDSASVQPTAAAATAPAVASTPPAPTPVEGVDVSHVQQSIDWAKVAAAGKSFAFIKATQGITVVDAEFSANWLGAKAAGLVRGAYHFYQPGDDPKAQAEHFLATVTLEPGDLAPVLDFETARESASGSSEATQHLLQDVSVWLTTVEAATGRRCLLYTSPGFWNALGAHDFGQYPLWVAEYGVEAPKAVAGWSTWTFWQYSESGQVDGISQEVDLDRFAGDRAALLSLTRSSG